MQIPKNNNRICFFPLTVILCGYLKIIPKNNNGIYPLHPLLWTQNNWGAGSHMICLAIYEEEEKEKEETKNGNEKAEL
jgi:hypothetical protein